MPNEYTPPMDPAIERRLAILETQMTQVLAMFSEIKVLNNALLEKVSSQKGNTATIEGQIQQLIDDVEGIKKQIAALDTLSFLVRNPKIALASVIGFAFIFVSDFRESLMRIFKAFFSNDV